MSRRFGRRTLLGGLAVGAAAAAGAPVFRALGNGTVPCRFLFVLEGNCFEPRTILAPSARAALDDGAIEGAVGEDRWWYRRYRHDALLNVPSADLGQAPALAGLDEMGVADRATAIFGLSSRIVGGGHSGYHGALSCTRTLSGRAGGQTIDAFLASLPEVRAETPFEAHRANVGFGPLNFGACAQEAGVSLPMINDPIAAHSVLYGAFADGGDARRAFERQRHLLAFLESDVQAAIADGRLPTREARKLELYGASVASLQQTQTRLGELSVAPAPVPAEDLAPLARFEAHMSLATSALIDGLTNVAVVGSGAGGPFSLTYSSVSNVGRHDMHHQSGGNATLRQAIVDVTAEQVRTIARAARRLADAPAPSGGSMLDNTVIVFIGDNGEQHHSTASEFPVLLIGGAGLAPGGRTLVYPGLSSDGHRQVSNLWNTLGYLAGAPLDEFGGEEGTLRRAAGPLDALLG